MFANVRGSRLNFSPYLNVDQLQRRHRKGVHDESNESYLLLPHEGLREDQVRLVLDNRHLYAVSAYVCY